MATTSEEQTSPIESFNVNLIEVNSLRQAGVDNLNTSLRAGADLDSRRRDSSNGAPASAFKQAPKKRGVQ